MKILGEGIDLGIDGINESKITELLFNKIRHNYPSSFIWKIPDIGKKMKPCDGIRIFSKNEIYFVEVKVFDEKNIKDFKKMFIKKMEPIQLITFNNLTKLGIPCLMIGYHIPTKKFYNLIY